MRVVTRASQRTRGQCHTLDFGAGTTPDKQAVKCEPWVPVVDPAEFQGFAAKANRWYERAEAACEGTETIRFTMEQFTGKA